MRRINAIKTLKLDKEILTKIKSAEGAPTKTAIK